jgi:hypothetical protein
MANSLSWHKRVWAWWKRAAAKIAHFQGHLILSLIYILVLAPVACVFKLFRQDPLRLSGKLQPSYWLKREPMGPIDEFMKRMY